MPEPLAWSVAVTAWRAQWTCLFGSANLTKEEQHLYLVLGCS